MTTNLAPYTVHANTMTVASLLAATEVGSILTYETIRKAINLDPQKEGRGFLNSARRIVMREHSAIFETVPNIGLLHLDHSGSAQHVRRRLRRVASQARMGQREMRCVEVEKLGDAERLPFLAAATALAIGARLGTQRTLAKLSQLVEGSKPPALPAALEELKRVEEEK